MSNLGFYWAASQYADALFAMDYSNPKHKEMMDLEGLKKWEDGRTTGFELLTAACEHQSFFAEA